MKLLKLLLPFLIMATGSIIAGNKLILNEPPAKTIMFKHPGAENATTFFSGSKVYNFEIFKAGTAAEMEAIVKSLSADKAVESCTKGNLYGDYLSVTLTLKSNKDKAWFIAAFKKAGLNHIRLNNHEIIAVDKL